MKKNSTSLNRTKCDAELYFDIKRQMDETGVMPQEAKAFLSLLNNKVIFIT